MTLLQQAAVSTAPSPPNAEPVRPAAARVSVADRASRSFPPLACVRGFRYFARARVDFVSASEKLIEADVKGKRTLRVRLQVDDGRLAAACTCFAKTMGPAACRHVWAVLLEVDRRGAFAALRATSRSLALGMVVAAAPGKVKAPRPKPQSAPPPGEAAGKASSSSAISSRERPSAGTARKAATTPAATINAAPKR